MANRLRLRPAEEENNGSLPSRDLIKGKLPVPAGDPLNVLFDMLATRDSSSILPMQRAPVRHLSKAQNVHTRTFCLIDESESAPPVSVLSVRRGSGPDTFRVEIEISWGVAEWLGRVGSSFWPIFGAVEEKRERARKKTERRARFDERMVRFKKAGRIGFHRSRKVTSPNHRAKIVAVLMDRYQLEYKAVELAIKEHGKAFRSALSKRRRRAIHRLNAEGIGKRDIAGRCKVSIGLVQHVLRGLKKK